MYKMVDISSKTWNKAGVAAITVCENNDANKTLLQLLCISDIAKSWGGKNIYGLTDKETKGKYKVKNMNKRTIPQIRKCKIDRARLLKDSKHSWRYCNYNNNAI